MAQKFATAEAGAMNHLYAGELDRLGLKKAQKQVTDEKGAPHDPQAFEDHKEYLDTLTAIMKEDEKTEGDPNDAVLD
jgi:hypothetical protein